MAIRANGSATSARSRQATSAAPRSPRLNGQRIRARMRRAQAAGISLGCPPSDIDLNQAIRLRLKGWSRKAVAQHMGVAKSTLADRLKALST